MDPTGMGGIWEGMEGDGADCGLWDGLEGEGQACGGPVGRLDRWYAEVCLAEAAALAGSEASAISRD